MKSDGLSLTWLRTVLLVAGLAQYANGIPSGITHGLEPTQIVVFDAGSSGTRVHIFDCYESATFSLPVIDLSVRSSQTLKVKPGLSSFARKQDLDGTDSSMGELLEFVDRFVPRRRRRRTPLLLFATAGLRAVSSVEAEAVLNVVRKVFTKSEYMFVSGWARIIPGKEEGGLSWVAANYLAKTFEVKHAESSSGSVGVIELGGGSIQVTAQVESVRKIDENDRFEFHIPGGKSYQVYAHSYMNYGQDYVQRTLIDSGKYGSAGVPEPDRAAPKGDPCYPLGYSRPWTLRACKANPILKVSCDGAAALNAPPVLGLGNYQDCLAMTSQFLRDSPSGPGKYIGEPPLRGHFIAIENFFYVRHDMHAPMDATSAARNAAGEKACKTAIPAGSKAATDASKAKACYALAYQSSLLEALKATEAENVEVKIVHQLNNADVDWALGAAIAQFLDQKHSIVVSDSETELVGLSQTKFLSNVALFAQGFAFIMVILFLYCFVIRGYFFGGIKHTMSSPALAGFGDPSDEKLA